jgi:hypothetical protein
MPYNAFLCNQDFIYFYTAFSKKSGTKNSFTAFYCFLLLFTAFYCFLLLFTPLFLKGAKMILTPLFLKVAKWQKWH